MIVSRIEGGLGNQMFQYALGRRLAESLGAPLALDVSPLESTRQNRRFGLHHLRIDAPLADANLRRRFPRRFGGQNWWQRWRSGSGRPLRLVRERGFPFQESVLRSSRECYLAGYWQCERYFAEIRPQLLREFAVRHPLQGRNAVLAARIQNSPSVAIHVRRGDYVSDPTASVVLGACAKDYYQRAVAHLLREVGAVELFVFSDDPAYCRAHLQWDAPSTVIDHNDDAHNYEDLRLMTLARHFIIANSSFSWWGAWLGQHADKIVVAPQAWFRSPELDGRDIVPSGWRRM